MSANENKERDELSGVETTGHEWDGIKELNNPLPRWWLWTFYGCIVWALGYTVVYPAWPLLSSATTGVLGHTTRGEFAKTMAAVTEANGEIVTRIAETPLTEILADDELSRFATSAGSSAFKVNCSQCHGTGAAGSPGYPNLNDDSWIWGGSIDDIYHTISHGVRSPTDMDTRYSFMPNFGKDELLDRDSIKLLAAYVADLSGIEGGAYSADAEQLFADNCASCHGEGGVGMAEMGAPSLADKIWLYEGTLASITAQIEQPRHGVMQAWSEKLDDVTIKQLAVYVHGLGGGQ